MSGTTSPTACGLTIVEAHGAILAKRWLPDGTCQQYDRARTVSLHAQPVADLAALADMLHVWLRAPRFCIVRAEPIDSTRTVRVRRLLHPCPVTGEAPTLREVARRWVAIDVDSVPVPSGTDLRDLAACARAVLPCLPHAFRDAACIVNATASHGIKPGVRLRLWFWLSRPTTGAELLEWFKASPVDPVTFRAAQPIYTAAPLFPGATDPLTSRMAMLAGVRDVVPVPAVLIPPRPAVPAPSKPIGLGLPRTASRDGGAMRFAALLRVVREAVEGERHPKLLWASLKAHELVKDGTVNEASARDALVQAAMDAGGVDLRSAQKTAEYGLKHGPRGVA
jgi:hypothetical protein